MNNFMQSGALVLALWRTNGKHVSCRYCIPTSDDRPITAAERKFFNECGTGLGICRFINTSPWIMTLFYKVPVIVLWTKTDALDLDKIKQLMKEGINQAEAMEQAPKKAWDDFEKKNYPILNHEFKYPPKAYVAFRSEHYGYSSLAVIG